MSFFWANDTPVMAYDICYGFQSLKGRRGRGGVPCLRGLSPTCDCYIRFTSGSTPAKLLKVSMAPQLLIPLTLTSLSVDAQEAFKFQTKTRLVFNFQCGKLPKDIAIERGDTDFVQMIDDFENRLSSSSVQPVRGDTHNENMPNSALSGGGEENCNSEPPPSYEEVMEQPSLFNRADSSHRDYPEDEEVDIDEDDDDENDDTAALLGS